jgi:hypothetical protein
MSAPHYARLASAILARIAPAPVPPPDPDERAQAIDAIARAIVVARTRQRLRLGFGVFAAAAVVLLTAFGGYRLAAHREPVAVAPGMTLAPVAQIVAHPVSGGSSVVVSGAQAPLDDGRLLGPGSRVVTPANGRAMLSFSTGSSVLLREGTDLTVSSEGNTQELHLDSGSVELHVAKLAPDHRFIVDTPDSEVEVRGTRFTVAIVPADPGCGAGARTRVAVTEGVVVVRHSGIEDRVTVGEQWPSGCVLRAAADLRGTAIKQGTGATTGAAPSTGSSLADQNDLFAVAASAKRRGDARGALAALDRFLGLYPASPLAEAATVERMRVLQTMGSPRAPASARDYLARYPNGFAHAEAEAIVSEGP